MTALGFIGGTGRLGQEIAKGLIKAEGFDSYKAFVRSPALGGETVQALQELGFEIVDIDFDDKDALEDSFRGIKTLVSTIAGGALWKVETKVIPAAKKAGVSLFVPSQFGVDIARFGANHPFLKAKENVLTVAENEGLPVLKVTCGLFSDAFFEVTGDPFNGEAKLVESDAPAKVSFTRRSDVGFVLAKALSDPEFSQGGTLAIAGETMTWKEALDVLVAEMPTVTFEVEKMSVDQAKSKVEEFMEKGENGDVWSSYKAFGLHLLVEPASGNNGLDMSESAKSYDLKMETLADTLKEVYKMPEDED